MNSFVWRSPTWSHVSLWLVFSNFWIKSFIKLPTDFGDLYFLCSWRMERKFGWILSGLVRFDRYLRHVIFTLPGFLHVIVGCGSYFRFQYINCLPCTFFSSLRSFETTFLCILLRFYTLDYFIFLDFQETYCPCFMVDA